MYPSEDGQYIGFKGARSRKGQGVGSAREDSEDSDSDDLGLPKVTIQS
jgi:hypothetical protein